MHDGKLNLQLDRWQASTSQTGAPQEQSIRNLERTCRKLETNANRDRYHLRVDGLVGSIMVASFEIHPVARLPHLHGESNPSIPAENTGRGACQRLINTHSTR